MLVVLLFVYRWWNVVQICALCTIVHLVLAVYYRSTEVRAVTVVRGVRAVHYRSPHALLGQLVIVSIFASGLAHAALCGTRKRWRMSAESSWLPKGAPGGPCKYGNDCYRKSLEHRAEFSHPPTSGEQAACV